MNPDYRARRRAQARRLRLLGAALVAALLTLVAGTALFARQMAESALRVERQLELNIRAPILRDTYETLLEAETGQRGYLLTGKPRYLEIYRQATLRVPATLRDIDDLGQRDPAFAARARRVRELATLKLAELERTVTLFGDEQPDQALALVQTDAGQGYMEEIRRILTGAVVDVRNERLDLSRRIIDDGARSRRFAVLAMSALLLTALLAAAQIRQLARSRRSYERDLLRSERQHREILEGQQEMVSLSDPSGRLLYVNPAYAALFARTPADLIGTSLYELVDAADREAVRAHLASVFAHGEVVSSENRMRSADGQARWVSWSNQLQLDAEGRPCLHSVGRDTTLEKALAQRLAERERFLRQITDAVPVRIAYVDRDRRVQFANQATLARYGRPRDEVIGRRRDELIANVAQDVLTPHIEAALRGQAQRTELPERHGQRLVTFDVELIPDLDGQGGVQGAYVVAIDITQRKEDERALRDLADIFEASPDAIVQTDDRGNITYLNPAARRTLGLAPGDPADGLTYADFHTDETNEVFQREALAAAHDHGSWIGETTMRVRGQVVAATHLLIAHRGRGGEVARYSTVLRDISDVVAQRRELRLQTATLAAVVEAIPAMIAVYDPGCRYRLVNRSFESWTGVARTRCLGHSIGEVFGAEEQQGIQAWADRALAGETVSFDKEVQSARRGRHINLSYLPLRLEDGTIDGFVGVGQDVTEQREETRRLTSLSERDPLTGLGNRAGVEAQLERCAQSGEHEDVALLFVDLDRFKPVNDELGHAAGDDVLRQFAARLQDAVRPTDVVGRMGGDEFAVVLRGVRDVHAATLVADKIVALARRPFDVAGRFVSIGASVGVAHGIDARQGWKELLDRADRRMYAAKRSGR